MALCTHTLTSFHLRLCVPLPAVVSDFSRPSLAGITAVIVFAAFQGLLRLQILLSDFPDSLLLFLLHLYLCFQAVEAEQDAGWGWRGKLSQGSLCSSPVPILAPKPQVARLAQSHRSPQTDKTPSQAPKAWGKLYMHWVLPANFIESLEFITAAWAAQCPSWP